MLAQEENELLTRVGPGTLMGNLLRRYWMPACLSSELPNPDDPPVRTRLLGEDLVAFRDTNGKVGLVANNCPHRGASVYFGRNEECGLRCVYHGWKFDVDGNCVDMPNEPATSNFKDKVKILAYPTHESGGMVWTYMGPRETMTPFRDFGTDAQPQRQYSGIKTFSSCNYVQAMEGNLDSAHISWLHQFNAVDDIPWDDTDRPGLPSSANSVKFWRYDRAPRIEVNDEWYGFRYAALRNTPNGHTHVRMSAFVYPYGVSIAGIPYGRGQFLCVPIDDENCWRWTFSIRSPRARSEEGRSFRDLPQYPYKGDEGHFTEGGIRTRKLALENDYQIDRNEQRNGTFTGIWSFPAQDWMVTESMGPIYDRSQEHLGTTDLACIRMRSLLIRAAQELATGKEPPAVAPGLDYRSIRSAERVLATGEDWRFLGTDEDPEVKKAEPLLTGANGDS